MTSACRKRRVLTPLSGGPSPVIRRPVKKVYGVRAKYGLAPGESAYERRRAERKANRDQQP